MRFQVGRSPSPPSSTLWCWSAGRLWSTEYSCCYFWLSVELQCGTKLANKASSSIAISALSCAATSMARWHRSMWAFLANEVCWHGDGSLPLQFCLISSPSCWCDLRCWREVCDFFGGFCDTWISTQWQLRGFLSRALVRKTRGIHVSLSNQQQLAGSSNGEAVAATSHQLSHEKEDDWTRDLDVFP